LRIGLLSDCYRPGVNGIVSFITAHKRALQEQGHDVFVLTWGRSRPEDEPEVIRSSGIPFVRPGYNGGLWYSRRALKILKTLDVLHANQPLFSGLMAVRYGKRYGIPVVFTGHSRYDLLGVTALPFVPLTAYRATLRPYMRWFTDRCDLVTVATPMAAETLHILNVTCSIEVIPTGIDLTHYRQPSGSLPRADLGLPASEPVAVFVGRLSPEKNVRFLLEALTHPDLAHAHLLIVGDGHERRRLERDAGRLSLRERVHFVGEVPAEGMPAYLSLADFAVTASQIEVLPFAILESLAAGLPILGVDALWTRQVIQAGVNGLLTEADAASFAHTWARLLEDAALREQLSAGARATSERYDARHTTALMASHYERLAAANSVAYGAPRASACSSKTGDAGCRPVEAL
jgi:glycosyltransferase involved in cell wall biosynthesis